VHLPNLIHKCFVSKHTPMMVRAFITYARPLLEYASPMWKPHLITDIKRIESCQRRFTKWLSDMADCRYRERLLATGLDSLELRRLRYDLTFTYKLISNKLFTALHVPYTPEWSGVYGMCKCLSCMAVCMASVMVIRYLCRP